MAVAHRFLFNFAVSYSSGGYKRLYEYARWFDAHGGAWFIIHPKCRGLQREFAANRFFIAEQSRLRRLYDDCGYLGAIGAEIGTPDLYYSYGIPIYARFGTVNWFHLSNVLPLGAAQAPLSVLDRLRFGFLGRRMRRGFRNADVISAESSYSLGLIGAQDGASLVLSVNGSDDELAFLRGTHRESPEEIAVVVGTYRYKALTESVHVFRMLREGNSQLKLLIAGNEAWIPSSLRGLPDVVVLGMLDRSELTARLRKAKFYISTTYVENSYNAASEGVFCAEESYISDIGPHRELLAGMPAGQVRVPGVARPLLHVKRDNLSGANLKSWDTVVVGMIAEFNKVFSGR
jgi:hypothetical protein